MCLNIPTALNFVKDANSPVSHIGTLPQASQIIVKSRALVNLQVFQIHDVFSKLFRDLSNVDHFFRIVSICIQPFSIYRIGIILLEIILIF